MFDLHVETRGAGQPVLLLLHGLGAHGGVWSGFVDALRGRFAGRVIVPDLRGHGRSPHARHYGYGQHAADVADLLDTGDEVFAVGHSMGGLVALMLAAGLHGIRVKAAFAFSTKPAFTEVELQKLAGFAATPPRAFVSREEAVARFLKASGLEGLVDPQSATAEAGVRDEDGRYFLAADPRAVLAAGPSLQRLAQAAACPVLLGAGPKDTIAPLAELERLGFPAVRIGDCGHNPHVEDPAGMAEIVATWLEEHR